MVWLTMEKFKEMRESVDVLTLSATPDSPDAEYGDVRHPGYVHH